MAHIVGLSSWVAHGHVGLSASAPVLQRLGHSVTQLPTVLLSNHPGWPHVAGAPVPVSQLEAMWDALCTNAWMSDVDALLIGYMPTPDHVKLAAQMADQLRQANPMIRVVVDPVMGDAPKGLYIDPAVAAAVRDDLLPKAEFLTPNLFELGWLTQRPVATLSDVCQAAQDLCARYAIDSLLVTSAPAAAGQIGVVQVTSGGAVLWQSPKQDGVPHGVGDVFAACIAGGVPVGKALGHLQALICASLGHPHLMIAESAETWACATAIASDKISETEG
ncbi:MAG: bifunctional hydroxymethylpyrimidine kinase/phosphomethylpyrimidine kinase [Rhodobacteraceae bacterium]|nr:bifunctional hydroxymethylpyrimidine kinase/phosphomethylpyrimidine kinase [Paracoccaceae bacterium]